MSLSKYPERLDLFQTKKDAAFDGDPNGDFVMADDVNQLQDAVSAIEKALGVNPQGSNITVGERITLLEGSSALRAPSFLIYLGVPSKINESITTLEAAGHFSKYDHVVLGNNAQDPADPDYSLTMEIIDLTRSSRDVKFYGYIDCGVNTLNLSISEIQVAIQQWKDMDAVGIYCANFGFEDRVSRERQNEILDSIHQHGMVAILDAANPEEVFTDLFHETMNPSWVAPRIQDGDVYHYNSFALDTSTPEVFEKDVPGQIMMLIKLYEYRVNMGIRIFGTPVIQTSVPKEAAQAYYDYAHVSALVVSLDAFHPVIEGYGAATDTAPTYDWVPIAGSWYSASPRIEYDELGIIATRETPFGRIILNTQAHTYEYQGIYIPYNLLKIAANTIEGNLLKDSTVEDIKIKNYKGSRLIDAINAEADATKTINIGKIAKFEYSDIDGAVPVDHLKANVIDAINAYIGTATIGEAFIGNLNASKITAGTIDADRITASVVEALNLYAENIEADSARIGEAVIGNLSAEKITAGDIDAERISAGVVDAINLSAKQADIQNLNADNITAGNIKADRIQAEVINAINLYAESAVLDKAVIKAAAVGSLNAGNIQAEVIKAINLSSETATIKSAVIGALEASHIEAAVIEAINLNAEKAVIEEAVIGDLSATKITSGTLDADIIKGSVVTAINFTTETAKIVDAVIDSVSAGKIVTGSLSADVMNANVIHAINGHFDSATIDEANIGNLSAEKIVAGSISADVMEANIVAAVNAYVENMTATSAKIDSAAMGVLATEHMQAKVLSAINASVETIDGKFARIDKAKIGTLDADNIEALAITTEKLNAGAVTADKIDTGAVTADKIFAGAVTADKIFAGAVTADKIDAGAVTADKILADSIESGHIKAEAVTADELAVGAVTADKIFAGSVTADKLDADAVTADKIFAGAVTTIKLAADAVTAEKIAADSIEAEHISTGAVTADAIYAGAVTATKVAADAITSEKIKAGEVKAGNIAANAIQTSHIQANQINSNHIVTAGLDATVIKTGFLSADRIDAKTITGNHIAANTLTSNHISTAGLDAAVIKSGYISADRIQTGSLDAMKITAGTITGREIAANTLTAREIQSGSITANEIAAGSISAEHISTVGLDAQIVNVYNSKTGETLIGGGYLRVDGLDAGVVQSDNLVGNGMFMTASSAYGIKRTNPAGEVIIGTESQVPGGNQIWKYDLETGALLNTIDVPGKKPAFIAIDGLQQYAYVTVQGDDTMKQLDLTYDTITENYRPMGKAPTRVKFTGGLLGDMKHVFAVNTDKTDVNAPDSFYVLDVPPHSDFQQFYLHHQFITGNTPYDFVMSEKDKKVYITLADQGDIAVLDASKFPTYQWKFVEAIPISPYGTDNYHGGLTAGFGIGTAVGGDASAEYNKDHGGHGGSHGGGHAHGGYSVSDGTMKEYKPHGIAIDREENFLLVAEPEQNELVIVNRVPEEHFEWPQHASYVENADWITSVNALIMMYDNNPEQAVLDGYTTASPFVPYMGYHFSKTGPDSYDPDIPNTLMYLFDTTVNQYKIVGAEWNVPDPTIPSPVPGHDWELAVPATATYADGLTITGVSQEDAPATHPETGSALVSWSPAIYGIHFFSVIENPVGLFATFNPKLEKWNSKQPQFPPGFENLVDPNMPASNYHEYVAPEDTGGHGGHTGGGDTGGDGGHVHSVGEAEIVTMASEEPTFSAMHTGEGTTSTSSVIPAPSPVEEDHSGHVMGPSPDTTGQGLVYKYIRHRIPVGDDPENVVFAGDKVWITLLGSNKIAVMNKSDLYRTPMDFEHFGIDWSAFVRYVEVGSKPLDIIKDEARGRLYVTVQGESKIAVVDIVNETVITHWTAGANVMSGDITPDGKYLYITNNGGVGELSFVYPDGPYIGDAFVGLEGDVRYQGADKWVPDRSDWVFNSDGTLRSSSSVEFRINEPFLNEGGYVRLAAQGLDSQYALIEQDIYNVTNFSNGNNFDNAEGDRLAGNQERTLWYPTEKWMLDKGGPTNIKIVEMVLQEDNSKTRVETIPDPSVYTIYYDTPRLEFQPGIIPEGAWVEADYVYRANVWFKHHNGSTLVAIENSSSTNFNTFFEVDEFVPKFITIDALQTKPFDYAPIINPGVTHGHFEGLQYSYKTNRAEGLPPENVILSSPQIDNGTGLNPCAPLNNNIASSDYVEVGPGLQSYTIDLGGLYMVPKIKVWHFWQDGRTYHNTKTEVSEDGINWVTVFDSAVSGEYVETIDGNVINFWAYNGTPPVGKEDYLAARPVRYVRDWINGNTVNTNNHWVELQVYADWELEKGYVYPPGSAKEGQQIATNGQGIVTTTISQADIKVNIPIDFTTWWYMTYLVGPEFGSIDFEMPTAMAGSHVLPLGNPYLNKIAHRHTMSFPPGDHQVIIRQRSGKVSIDRLRFEDFQYYDRSTTRIPSTADSSFTRYKIVPEQAKDYVGVGNQSTYGPYDTPRVNPDTKQADQSVPVKYRFRVKAMLDAAGLEEEQGVAYVTSAIFEQGKLSSHWRPSSSSDFTPGNRIEPWDGNHPHSTGIQWFHLANGAIRGTKILPSAIMDYHISPYARIGEYKLDLNYPTHPHGHWMTDASGTPYFYDNKAILDSIHGWAGSGGSYGTKNTIARGDHTHPHIMHDVMIHGKLDVVLGHGADNTDMVYGFINGVDIVAHKSSFDNHVASTDLHFSAAERTKLAGIAEGATKVEDSTTNGNIKIDGVQNVVYTHPTTDGNKHVPATGTTNNGKYLKAGSTAGSLSWSLIDWSEIQSKPTTFTPPVATSDALGGVKVGSGLSVAVDGTVSWSHPTTSGNKHIPSGGVSGNALKWSADGTAVWGSVAWSEVTGKPTNISYTGHTHTSADITDLNTVLSAYATKEELSVAGEVKLAATNTFTGQNIFTKADGPAIVIKPSTAPTADTVLMQIANTSGANMVTIDSEGDVVIEANLTVRGTTTYNGTNEVQGDYTITGNMDVGGSTTLGTSATDQTTIKGDLVVEGNIKPKGKSVEVARVPVFGMAGDLQFQTDSIVYEDIISHYWTFSKGDSWAIPEPESGATRKYRLMVSYSTKGALSDAKLRIVQYGGTTAVGPEFTLPTVNGALSGIVRHFRTPEFTTAYAGHTTFQAMSAGVDKDLVIKHIEVIAYDYFA